MVILEIKGLTTGYTKGNAILKDLSLSVMEGEFIGVVGPNGSGKSTLIKSITNILGVWRGDVKTDGTDISKLSRDELAKICAVVPQDTYIRFPYTVEEVVLMGRSPYLGKFDNYDKQDREIAKDSMKETKTHKFRDKKINELSGGEMQRVIIARALTQDPDLLLLDEATSHLDVGHKKDLMDTIKKKNEKDDLSVISVHHNLNLAARYCEKILLLDDGQKHTFGKPEEVLTNANLRSVYGIEADIHEHPKDGTLYVSPVDKKVISKSREKKVHIVCGGNSTGKLLKGLVEKGYEVSAGVVNVMDSDFEKAEYLDIDTVDEAPFSPISLDSYKENVDMIKNSDMIVVTDFPVGEGNLRNLEAVKEGMNDDKELILVDPNNIRDRDYTENKRGSELYNKIKKEHEVRSVESTDVTTELL